MNSYKVSSKCFPKFLKSYILWYCRKICGAWLLKVSTVERTSMALCPANKLSYCYSYICTLYLNLFCSATLAVSLPICMHTYIYKYIHGIHIRVSPVWPCYKYWPWCICTGIISSVISISIKYVYEGLVLYICSTYIGDIHSNQF